MDVAQKVLQLAPCKAIAKERAISRVKKVKPKDFRIGDLVWEAVLPLGTKDKKFGKWSPTWHGPYKVDQVLPGNAYMLKELDGVKFPVAVNGQHLKKYFPSMWEGE